MSGRDKLEERMEACIASGEPFTADDVTDCGNITLAGEHAPNGTQNGIGSLFREYAARKLIEPTGRVVKSAAKHRKGGMIREWVAVRPKKKLAAKRAS